MLTSDLERSRGPADSGYPFAPLSRALCGTRCIHWRKWNTNSVFRQQEFCTFF